MSSKILKECLKKLAILSLILGANLLHLQSESTRPALRDSRWNGICMTMMLQVFVNALYRTYRNLFIPWNVFKFFSSHKEQPFFNLFPCYQANRLNHFNNIQPLNREKRRNAQNQPSLVRTQWGCNENWSGRCGEDTAAVEMEDAARIQRPLKWRI